MATLIASQNESIYKFIAELKGFLSSKGNEAKDPQLQERCQMCLDFLDEVDSHAHKALDEPPANLPDEATWNTYEPLFSRIIGGLYTYVYYCVSAIITDGQTGLDHQLVKNYIDMLQQFRVLSGQGGNNVLGKNNVTHLFLKGVLEVLDKYKKQMRLSKDNALMISDAKEGRTPNSEVVEKLVDLFQQLTTKVDTELLKQLEALLKKLTNLRGLCHKVVDFLDKKRDTEDLMDSDIALSLLRCDQGGNVVECFKKLGVESIVSGFESISGPGGVEKVFNQGGINTLYLFCKLISVQLKELCNERDEETQNQCYEFLPSKVVEDILYGVGDVFKNDTLYYEILNAYDALSGSVRVYVRTKDVNADGSGIPVITDAGGHKEVDQLGVSKDFDNMTISLENAVEKNDIMHYGPFYNIVPAGKTNEQIVKEGLIDVQSFASSIISKKVQNIVLFTYGFSGSGKTFSLFGGNGQKGIWHWIEEQMMEEGLHVRFAGYTKLYGYYDPEINAFQVGDKEKVLQLTLDKDFDTFINDTVFASSEPDSEGCYTDANSFIKTTPNNPQSSRGFLLSVFDIFGEAGGKLGRFGLVDMAGNEDPYDLMITLLPTFRFPREDSEKHFLVSDNFKDVDIVYDFVSQQVLHFVIIVFKTIFYLVDKCSLAVFGSKIDEAKAKVIEQATSIFNQWVEDEKYVLSESRNGFTEFEKQLCENMTDKMCNSLSSIFPAILQKVGKKYKIADIGKSKIHVQRKVATKKLLFDIKQKDANQPHTLAFAINFEEYNTSETMLEMTYYAIRKQLEQLEKSGSVDSSVLGISTLHWEKDVEKIRDAGLQYMYTELNKNVKSETTEESLNYVALCVQMCNIVKQYQDAKKSTATAVPVTSELILSFDLQQMPDHQDTVRGKSAEVPFDYIDSLFGVGSSDAQPVNSKLGRQKLQKAVDSVLSALNAGLQQYFAKTKKLININGSTKAFGLDYLKRILYEGIYINQANAELIAFLKDKREQKGGSNHTGCAIDKKDLYFNKYNKFANLFGDSYCSLISDMLLANFEGESKYIMLCNVRLERDIKFRMGAINTLELVKDLMST